MKWEEGMNKRKYVPTYSISLYNDKVVLFTKLISYSIALLGVKVVFYFVIHLSNLQIIS
jgi:hypothetical protein